jgi:uncharacterized membrane protein
MSVTAARTTTFIGPLPAPSTLAEYDKSFPGLGERIVKWTEDEMRHRHKKEAESMAYNNRELEYSADANRRGQIFGLIIALSSFITCIISLAMGSTTTATALGSTTVLGLTATFVYRRKNPPKEPKE